MKKLTFAAIVLGIALLLTSSASAVVHHYKVVATADADTYTDFHVEITCPVAQISNVQLIEDPEPGGTSATLTVTGEGTGFAEVDIDWGGAVLAAGAEIEIRFDASVEDVCTVAAYWTIGGEFEADAEIYYDEVPSLTQYGLIGLAVLIALTGLWMVYRRKRVRNPA